jgi:hypothetical protein
MEKIKTLLTFRRCVPEGIFAKRSEVEHSDIGFGVHKAGIFLLHEGCSLGLSLSFFGLALFAEHLRFGFALVFGLLSFSCC